MFSNEVSDYFNSVLSQTSEDQASADSAQVHFTALRSAESASGSASGSALGKEVRQITEQQDTLSKPVEPSNFPGSPIVWLLPVWGAIVWLLLFCTASEAWKLVRHNVTSVKQGQRVPCKNCRYFSNNFYLKCTVRPSDALTDRAIDCSDFCQKSSTEAAKPQTKRSARY